MADIARKQCVFWYLAGRSGMFTSQSLGKESKEHFIVWCMDTLIMGVFFPIVKFSREKKKPKACNIGMKKKTPPFKNVQQQLLSHLFPNLFVEASVPVVCSQM